MEAILGQSAELPCNVTAEKEDDKLNILAWYRNGSTTAFYRWLPLEIKPNFKPNTVYLYS